MRVRRAQLPPAATVNNALAALRAAAPTPEPDTLLRLEVPLTSAPTPLDWIARQPPGERLYWSDRDGAFRLAGLGVADRRPLPSSLSSLPRGGGVRWLGGLAFDPSREPSSEWAPFGRGQLILPHLVLEQRGPTHILALHILPGGPTTLPTVRSTAPPATSLISSGQTFEPGLGGWSGGVRAAVSAIRDGEMRKVVLSRRARVALVTAPDPFTLLAQLSAPQVSTFDFCFELSAGWAFLGCTPERLFSKDGSHLETEALAGTRRRGATATSDAALSADLLSSDKDLEEHEHVAAAITEALSPLCTSITSPDAPSIRRLHRVQHLHTPFSGTLHPGIDEAALLSALHPTPAVCGQPAQAARAFIQAHEPFHRGWYAGPVGWVGENQADFAVGIRSALLRGRSLWVCAGAGLVAASQPEAEWQELDAKSGQFLSMVESA